MKESILLIFTVFILVCTPVSLVAGGGIGGGGSGGVGGEAGGGIGGGSSGMVKLQNPLGNIDSFHELIEKILDAAFIIGLPIAVLFIVLAGFRFVWARGNPTELTKAKTNFLYTIVGIAVFFGAWLIAKVIETTMRSLGIGV